nr:hypothetical protein [Tanacetum cinerariifolium]GEV62198.1 hypothetical protein [Tanacetum cinerariifolium]
MYFLVVIDDFSRFSWVFFLATKDETSEIHKTFITDIENLIDLRVKVIRCDNGTKFKSRVMNQFCEIKGIKREFSVSRTSHQNRVAERKNKTLIEAARTMLVDSKLPTTFWAEAVNTAFYVQNRVLVIKPHNKTPYELFLGKEKKKNVKDLGNKDSEVPSTKEPRLNQEKDSVNSTNRVNVVSSTINAASNEVNAIGRKSSIKLPDDLNMPKLEDISIFKDSNEYVFGAEADLNNLESTFQVSPISITRIHKDHPLQQVIGDLHLAPKTRRISKNLEAHGLGHTQEEDIDYDEVFALVIRIEAIRLFLAYASFKDFMVFQMDVKSAFLYGKIKEEVYICQPPGFEDPDFPNRVYKVEKALYGLHQAPRAWSTRKEMCTESEKMMHKKFHMSYMEELTFFLKLQVKQKEDGIFISQYKYVTDILNKFCFSYVKTASTPMETHKTLLKDEKRRRLCACARFQVNFKISHLHAVKRIFRYLKGQPKLGLWYPKDSPFDLVAYTDSDYAGANLDRKSTTGGYSNKKKLIQMIKIHIDSNVTDLLTKALDATATVKNINGKAQLHAKVDGKKVVISEASIMRDLRFGDEGGIDCLPNETIFEQISLIGAKTSAWNKFSNTIESLVICLATDQKFNFSKYIFDSMVKNLDSATKFLMFPSLERDTTTTGLDAEHDRGNISKTQSKVTPNEPSFLRTSSGGGPRRQDTMGNIIAQTRSENVSNFSNNPLLSRVNTLKSGEDRLKLKELIEIFTKLSDRVLNLETAKTAQVGLSARVESSKEESLGKEDAFKQGRISNIDANQDIYLVNVHKDENIFGVNDQDDTSMFDADRDLQGEEVIIEKEVDSKDASAIEEIIAASIATSVTATTPTISMDEITLAKALIEIKTSRPKAKGIVMQEPSEVSTSTPIVSSQQPPKIQDKDDRDEVTIDATPLSSKSPTIVDYKIYKEGKKNFFQIFRADGNSQMYLTFSKLLKNFDREDLKVLWRLVKDRFVKTKPMADMDNFLMHTLKTMFEHHLEDTVWKSQ